MSPAGAATHSTLEAARQALHDLVSDVADFPEPGIVFKDITPLLGDPTGFAVVIDALAELATSRFGEVEAVVGMEARGFVFAAPLALALGVGFVPVRKVGKLPRETHAVSYALEYAQATLEMHRDALRPGARVLVVDDVLATGGTVRATQELVEACGASVAGVVVLLELGFLPGRETIGDVPFASLLTV